MSLEDTASGMRSRQEFLARMAEIESGNYVAYEPNAAASESREITKTPQERVRDLPVTQGFEEFWNGFERNKILAEWDECLAALDVKDPKQAAEYCLLNAQIKVLDPDLYLNRFTQDINLRQVVIKYIHSLENAINTGQFLKYAKALEILRPKEDPQDFNITSSEWKRLAKYIEMLYKHSNFSEFARLYSEAAYIDLDAISSRLEITPEMWQVLQNILKTNKANPNLTTPMSMHLRVLRPKGKSEVFVSVREWGASCKSAKDAYKWAMGEGSESVSKNGWLGIFLDRSVSVKYASVETNN